MQDILTRLDMNRNGDVTVETFQDAQDIADEAQFSRENVRPGRDIKPKWSLPNNLIYQFYLEYCGPTGFPPPMNQEFWEWVDKKKMTDPAYSKFRTDDPSNPFFSGYGSKR